jgi:hypothetical protein
MDLQDCDLVDFDFLTVDDEWPFFTPVTGAFIDPQPDIIPIPKLTGYRFKTNWGRVGGKSKKEKREIEMERISKAWGERNIFEILEAIASDKKGAKKLEMQLPALVILRNIAKSGITFEDARAAVKEEVSMSGTLVETLRNKDWLQILVAANAKLRDHLKRNTTKKQEEEDCKNTVGPVPAKLRH